MSTCSKTATLEKPSSDPPSNAAEQSARTRPLATQRLTLRRKTEQRRSIAYISTPYFLLFNDELDCHAVILNLDAANARLHLRPSLTSSSCFRFDIAAGFHCCLIATQVEHEVLGTHAKVRGHAKAVYVGAGSRSRIKSYATALWLDEACLLFFPYSPRHRLGSKAPCSYYIQESFMAEAVRRFCWFCRYWSSGSYPKLLTGFKTNPTSAPLLRS